MSDNPIPVQRSQLDAQALVGWLASSYDLPTPLACQFWNRSINDAYQVQAALNAASCSGSHRPVGGMRPA